MSEAKHTGPSFSVKFRDDVSVERARNGRITLVRWGRRFPGVPEDLLIERLRRDWLTEEAVDDLAESAADPAAAYYLCAKMFSLGFLQARCTMDGQPLFSLIPAPDWREWQGEMPAESPRLSSVACLRREGHDFVLEVPLSERKCLIHEGKCLAWLMEFAKGNSSLSVEDEGFGAFFRALHMIGALEWGEEANPVWEPHDLMFFHQSSLGFHDDPTGATRLLEGKLPPEPVFKPARGECVSLPEPGPRFMERLSAPFIQVLAARRSGRIPGSRPITVAELGALLHASARIQDVLNDPRHTFPVSFRPSPSGGALHSLEIYPLVHLCEDLARGVWRYDPAEHRLESVPADSRLLDTYLRANPHAVIEGAGLPHIRLVITSRFEREAWKYEKIACRLVLQDLGCLYQTLSLTAEALGLSSCILGTVDAKTLGAILTLEPLVEPVMGEMTVSTR